MTIEMEKAPDERFAIWPLQTFSLPSSALSAKSKGDLGAVQDKYDFCRRVKGDGNCFYRSVMYAYLEVLILKRPKYISCFRNLYL